jgi:DNA-directed RNA polymerase subunit RPC12/RpoP
VDHEVECPRCGAWVVCFIDPRGGERQELEEPCPECGERLRLLAVEEEPGGFAVGLVPPDEA